MKIIETKNAPQAIGPYSQGIITGELVYTSGQIGINPSTGNIDETTIEGQTRQVIANIDAILEAAGTDLSKVIKTTCFLNNISDFAVFQIFPVHLPSHPRSGLRIRLYDLKRDGPSKPIPFI